MDCLLVGGRLSGAVFSPGHAYQQSGFFSRGNPPREHPSQKETAGCCPAVSAVQIELVNYQVNMVVKVTP
jgi:hypothetical protein